MLRSGLVDLDDTSHSGKTALYVAAEQGSNSSLVVLLSAGARISILTPSGRNALHAAVERDQQSTVDLLCRFASVGDITCKCNTGVSPFMLAENRGRMQMMISMLALYQREVAINKSCFHPYLTAQALRYSQALSRRPKSQSLAAEEARTEAAFDMFMKS